MVSFIVRTDQIYKLYVFRLLHLSEFSRTNPVENNMRQDLTESLNQTYR